MYGGMTGCRASKLSKTEGDCERCGCDPGIADPYIAQTEGDCGR